MRGRRAAPDVGRKRERALPDHMAGDIADDGQTQVAEPGRTVQQSCDPSRSETGQGNGQDQTKHQHLGVFPGGAGDSKHIVQRHGNIGDQDLGERLKQGLWPQSRRP